MHYYKRTEFSPYCLYTAGYSDSTGEWQPISDHETEEEAAKAVHYLNGGNDTTNNLLKSGIELIAEERQRQIEKEGWTPEHDEEHVNEEIAFAAACYVTPSNSLQYCTRGLLSGDGDFNIPELWPWEDKWWKPSPDNRIKELVKAAALIAAEIDRLQRQESKPSKS